MRRFVMAISLLALACAVVAPSFGSDHADPIFNTEPDAGLTGLFVFPVGGEMGGEMPAEAADPDLEADASTDHAAESADADASAEDASEGEDAAAEETAPTTPRELIVILGIHPALLAAGPYDVEDYRYNIFIDHHSEVQFSDPADLARYGGTVVHPKGISPDVTMRFRLNGDATLAESNIEGMDSSQIEVVSGVYDDPFIFPRFFGKNVIAIALRIPVSALPEGREDFLFWGTTEEAKSGDQVDHVGRSNRTQVARFDFLNTVPPNEHVEVIHQMAHKRQKVQNFLKRYPPPALWQAFQLLQNIRHYDYAPDVMIFSFRNEAKFPNGRQLADDIVGIICETGECLLQETAFQESEAFPRITTNDKPFTDEFPYLAAPWPDEKPERQPGCFFPTLLILIVLGLLAWVFFKIVCKICRRKSSS